MKNLIPFLFLAFAFTASALDRVTATVTFLGGTTNAQTITVNGSARTWKNTVATPSTEILTNGLAGSAATNAMQHFAGYPVASVSAFQSATNVILFRAADGVALTVSLSPTNYGTVTYSTQTVAELYTVRVPMSAEVHGRRITNATQLVQGLDSYATASFSQSATALLNHVSLSNSQTMGNKTITNTTYSGGTNSASWITNAVYLGGNVSKLSNGVYWAGTLTNAAYIGGNVARLTNGVWTGAYITNATASGLTMTNGANYGNAFSSAGSGANSEQFGANALAEGDASLALGYGALASLENDIAIGGNGFTVASGGDSIALGSSASAGAASSIAIGHGATVAYANSISVGTGSEATSANQIRIGAATISASIQNDAHIGDNLSIGNDWAIFTASLAKGLQITNGTAASANPTNGANVWVSSGEIQYRTSATSEGADNTMRLHNRSAVVAGSGSDFTIAGTSYARVDFGGTDVEASLPTAGTYLVTATVALQTGGTPNDQFNFKLYNSTAAADVANSDTRTTDLGTSVEHACTVTALVTVTTASTIQIYGQNATATRGGVASARTRIIYVRLH